MLQKNYRLRKYASIIAPLIGIIIIGLMISLVWFWETRGRELYFYEEVVVLNQDVKRGTIITEEMLINEKFEVDKLIDNVVIDKNQIVGLEARHFIPKDSQLHPFYFEQPQLTTDQNTLITRIPTEWLYSIPNTLRRNDEIVFYYINDSSSTDDNNTDDSLNTHSNNEGYMLVENLGKPVLTARVAYVKDSANREVQTLSSQSRMDGSSVIAEVLVLLNFEQLQLLERYVMKGGKFIIMHSEGANDSYENTFDEQ